MTFGMHEVVWSVVVAWLIAQLFKILTFSYKKKRMFLKAIIMGGGMPSSHTSTITALTFAIGLNQGFKTPLFFATLIFSLFIVYQVLHEKRVTAALLAVIATKHPRGHVLEELGHSIREVIFGVLIGLVVVLAFLHN